MREGERAGVRMRWRERKSYIAIFIFICRSAVRAKAHAIVPAIEELNLHEKKV